MDSLSELCRGFSVASIDVLAQAHMISGYIRFEFPHIYFNSRIPMNTYANFRRQFFVNLGKGGRRRVKLSLSLERKLNGYVSIKL